MILIKNKSFYFVLAMISLNNIWASSPEIADSFDQVRSGTPLSVPARSDSLSHLVKNQIKEARRAALDNAEFFRAAFFSLLEGWAGEDPEINAIRHSICQGDEVSLRLTSLDISVCDIIRDNEHLITALNLQFDGPRPKSHVGWVGTLQSSFRRICTDDINFVFNLPVLERLTLTNAMIQGPNFTVYMGLQFPL